MRSLRRASVLIMAITLGALAPAARPTPVLAACSPVADYVTLLEDHAVFVDAVGNDTGCNYVAIADQPGHGVITDDPFDDVGNWVYTPAANYFGPDQNEYHPAFDENDVQEQDVFYTVTPVNDAPEVAPFAGLGGMEDAAGFYSLPNQATAGPSEASQTLSATMTTGNPSLFASGPTLVLAPSPGGPYWSATITWTPKPDACGTSQQTITITDNGGTANGGDNSETVTPTLTITCVNNPTVVRDDSYATKPGVTLSVDAAHGVLANDTDVDGDVITWIVFEQPTHGALGNLTAQGSFTYVPDAGFEGIDTFQYQVGGGMTGTVTIRVDGTSPLLVSRSPTAGTTGRPRDTGPTVTFNEPMNPATVTSSTFKIKDLTTGSLLAASASYSAASKKITLTPSSLLPAGHLVKVYATTGIKDLAGNSFAGTSWSFRVSTDATRPRVVTKRPSPSSTGVSRTANVYATFSESMRASTITTSTFRLKDTSTGSIVSATVTYDASLKRAKLNPAITLAARRTYQVLVSSNIRDRAGNRLYSTSWSFKTGS